MSREQILANVLKNQPTLEELPSILNFDADLNQNKIDKFIAVSNLIGSKVVKIKSLAAIDDYVNTNFKTTDRIFTLLPELAFFTPLLPNKTAHQFANIELAILKPHFAVAENGAVWLTANQMGNNVIPFIAQHLAMVVNTKDILVNMHQAYQIIQNHDYNFATFIAGPSKTADIEQSLVLGAHGARSMTIFLLEN